MNDPMPEITIRLNNAELSILHLMYEFLTYKTEWPELNGFLLALYHQARAQGAYDEVDG